MIFFLLNRLNDLAKGIWAGNLKQTIILPNIEDGPVRKKKKKKEKRIKQVKLINPKNSLTVN